MTRAYFRDLAFIALTRGSGFLITAAMLFSNSYARGHAAYSQIGQELALATLFAGPPLAILSQIQIRRVTANGDMARYLTPAKFVSLCTVLLALTAFLVQPDLRFLKISVSALLASMAFVSGQSVLVSTLLLSSLTGNTRTQIMIGLSMVAAVVGFSILRISDALPAASQSLLLESCVLWLAGLAAIFSASLVPLQPVTKPVYPFSVSTMAKYAIAIAFFNGLLVLDWQLLSSGLRTQDFAELSQIRVTIERLLMPFLATVVSALLVGRYRQGDRASLPPIRRMPPQDLRRHLMWTGPTALIIVALSALYWPLSSVLLPLGYLASSGVSYYLDLFQARHSVFKVFASLAIAFALYALASWMAIHWVGAVGHALAWLTFNLVLTGLLALSTKAKT